MPYMIALCLVFVLLSGSALAGDADRGKKLHDSQCIRCHGIAMYQRERHITQDWETLRGAVSHWQRQLRLQWKAADIDDVAAYLNQQFFHYPTPTLVCEGGGPCSGNTRQSSLHAD